MANIAGTVSRVWAGIRMLRLNARARRWGGWARYTRMTRRAGARPSGRGRGRGASAPRPSGDSTPSRRRWRRCAGRSNVSTSTPAVAPRALRGVGRADGTTRMCKDESPDFDRCPRHGTGHPALQIEGCWSGRTGKAPVGVCGMIRVAQDSGIHRSKPVTVLQRTDLTTSQKIQCAAAAVAGQHTHGAKTGLFHASCKEVTA